MIVSCCSQDYVFIVQRCLSVLLGQAVEEIHWLVNNLKRKRFALRQASWSPKRTRPGAGAWRAGEVSVVARWSWRGTAQDFLSPRHPCLGGGLGPSKITLSRLALPLGNCGDDNCSRVNWISSALVGFSQRRCSEIGGALSEKATALPQGSGHRGFDGSCSLATDGCPCVMVWPRFPCDSLVAPLGPPLKVVPPFEALM